MRQLERDLINPTSVLLRRGNLDTQRDTKNPGMCVHREKTVWGHRVTEAIPQAKERALRRNQLGWPLALGLLVSRIGRNLLCSLWWQPPQRINMPPKVKSPQPKAAPGAEDRMKKMKSSQVSGTKGEGSGEEPSLSWVPWHLALEKDFKMRNEQF